MKPFLVISIGLIGFIFLNGFPDALGEPILYDDNLILEEFTKEFGWGYTTMTFVGEDILILEKNGFVKLIRDGVLQEKPVLEVSVNSIGESGLLGITNVESTVFLYFTEKEGGETIGNRIYKYDWDGEQLINPRLIKELGHNSYHNGGVMVTGLDNQVYAVIGDTGIYGPLQNKLPEDIFPPDTVDYLDTSVILQVEPEGPYHAIGIRNSFGMAIDPLNGNLWITENGDDDFDEINFVPYKFNSGWNKIMGPATEDELSSLPTYEDYVYGEPKFTWEEVVAPVALNFGKFKETKDYDNSLFVGDCITGNLYKFELNTNRDGFEFSNPDLHDNVVNKNESMEEIIIGTGFRCITDIERGPDGFLYLISHGEKNIYRILPREALAQEEQMVDTDTKPPEGGGCLIATATFGSELAPQVQNLRELRDEKLLKTESGSNFMNTFNELYYSFSPQIADYERKNPIFKEIVKLSITPMISSLSILEYVNIETETEVLGYGISLILLNLGMYFVIPAMLFVRIKKLI